MSNQPEEHILDLFQSEELPNKVAKITRPFDAVAAMLVRETTPSAAQGLALKHLYEARKEAIKATGRK